MKNNRNKGKVTHIGELIPREYLSEENAVKKGIRPKREEGDFIPDPRFAPDQWAPPPKDN